MNGVRMWVPGRIAAVVLAGSVMAVPGCAPPKGEGNGRVESTNTTPAERNSGQVLPTSLVEFSDQVAQQLAADLNHVPELNQGYRSTIVFGDLVNKTGVVPTTDFEAFRTRIRQKLMQSEAVKDKVRFVASRSQLDSLRQREIAGSGDGQDGGTRGLSEDTTYFLNGEMYNVSRESANMYLMSFHLMGARDGDLVWESSPYDVKQVR